jgi:hemolysin D
MSPVYHKSTKALYRLFEEHSSEGISVLTREPSRLTRMTIHLLFGLLIAGLVWLFIGRADTIVVARGTVTPELRQYQIYVPIKGELANVYVAEGMPVAKGDIMFRIDSPSAIELLGRSITTTMQLADTERSYEAFPAKKKAMEKELAALRAKLDVEREQQAKRVAESIAKLAEEQTLKLQKARTKLTKARQERDHAKEVMAQHKRLFKSPGGGGVSRQKVEEKIKQYEEKVLDVTLAEVELGEFEASLKKEYEKRKAAIHDKAEELLALESRYENKLYALENEKQTLESDLRIARAKARTASRITYDDIDEDNYLRIRSPIDGVITTVAFDKVGDKVDDKTPIAAIAPEGGRNVLALEILERDRAFLKVGMPVKIKVNAFPYQRYGFLSGQLEYIAPTTTVNLQSKEAVYKARVGLEREFFYVNKVRIPLRLGMMAKVEVVVRKRRLVELVLDPLRNVAG